MLWDGVEAADNVVKRIVQDVRLSTPQPDPFRPLAEPDVANAAPARATVGASCEPTRITQSANPWLDRAEKLPRVACEGVFSVCEKTSVGFPGGMCSTDCKTLGRVREGFVCADLPASGYETDCFPLAVPIEKCLETHSARRIVRGCDATHPCRDDYACARVPGLPPREGACVPPYFVFQARVDGPVLDR